MRFFNVVFSGETLDPKTAKRVKINADWIIWSTRAGKKYRAAYANFVKLLGESTLAGAYVTPYLGAMPLPRPENQEVYQVNDPRIHELLKIFANACILKHMADAHKASGLETSKAPPNDDWKITLSIPAYKEDNQYDN